MVVNKVKILRKLNELKEELKINYKVKTIGLFGSYVKNEQKDTSDIDFLVEFEDQADLFHFIDLTYYLEGIFNTKVDVISKQSLKEDLRKQILEEVIYE